MSTQESHKRNLIKTIICAIISIGLAIWFGKNIYNKYLEGEPNTFTTIIYFVWVIGCIFYFIDKFRKIKNNSL